MLTFCVGVYLGSTEVVGARFSERTVLAARRWCAEHHRDRLARGHHAVLTQMVDDRSSRGARRWTGTMVVESGGVVVQWIDTTPTAWKPRGICPECGGTFALTTRGTLAPHGRADGRTVRTLQGARVPASCDGAAQKPSVCQTGEPARI